jgi:hypothetical protein
MIRFLLCLVTIAWATGPISVSAQLWGDFNDNGSVDAADYTIWRNYLDEGDIYAYMPNDPIPYWIMEDDYTDVWRPNFGNPGGGGVNQSVVPEPSSVLLGLIALSFLCLRRKFRG